MSKMPLPPPKRSTNAQWKTHQNLNLGQGEQPHDDITASTPDQSFESSMMDHAPSGSLARAVQLAVAYAIEHRSHQPGKLQQLLQLQGNMRTRYQHGIKHMGGFLRKYVPSSGRGTPGFSGVAAGFKNTFCRLRRPMEWSM